MLKIVFVRQQFFSTVEPPLLNSWKTMLGIYYIYTWSDNKVRELATMCLPWQHGTKALVWFDDVDISAFHSYVVVDLWQSLS